MEQRLLLRDALSLVAGLRYSAYHAEAPAQAVPTTSERQAGVLAAAGAGRTVLVIDDEPRSLETLRRTLEEEFKVLTAESAAEAERLASGLEADFGDEAQSPDPEFEALKFFSVPEKSVSG